MPSAKPPRPLSMIVPGTLVVCLIGLFPPAILVGAQDYPIPRTVMDVETIQSWQFASGTEGLRAVHDCRLESRDGRLVVIVTGDDPYLHSRPLEVAGPCRVRIRMRGLRAGPGQIFWITDRQPHWSEDQSSRFPVELDDEWHEYEVDLPADGEIRCIRLDPGGGVATVEIDRIELLRYRLHPLEIQDIESDAGRIGLALYNHESRPIAFTLEDRRYTAEPAGLTRIELALSGGAAFEAKPLVIQPDALPEIRRTVFLYRLGPAITGPVLRNDKLTVRTAGDAAGAELEIDGRVVAVLAPLVHIDGALPAGRLVEADGTLRWEGSEDLSVILRLEDEQVHIRIESKKECEGPVLRAPGPLAQGVFAGLEYLGPNETSSSRLDIETEEHLRFAPDILKVTLPLMACRTDQAAVAMTWRDMHLQPVFAAPNRFDGSDDQRMALRGRTIEATILVKKTSLEETILWATRRLGLPSLPPPPRNEQQQNQLCLAALNGPVSGPGGWGHCAEDRWPRHPFADHASTLWRLTGQVPPLETITPGGAHIPNDAIYFVTGRIQEWLDHQKNLVGDILKRQQPDGSFRYDGSYRRGHFEDTASGLCALPARQLLEFAWLTGDPAALAGGRKTLDFMKRFHTPRGAQTWEVPLHTPDILASANLVWAYVRGYELTGNTDYLQQARKWALSGVPFVYLWGDYHVMTYATIPVFGATNWIAPNWMGLPVQWCGLNYAYALTLLSPYDDSLDWHRLAEGILIAGEQMQYPDGEFVGTLPDSFVLRGQQRRPWNINPCALVSLRRRLAGWVDSLAVAAADGHRVAAPFPVRIQNGRAVIQAPAGTGYQVLIDGRRIVEVTSQGMDAISLE